ncbi:MAG: hypothetical protein HGN29_11730 [Asgard group archaeon]|nr:hypothetical protein [Asgard group archaeon]
MERKLRILIVIGIIIGIFGALIPPLYIFVLKPRKDNDLVFPLLLLDKSTISDMILENDDKVHFIISSFNNQSYGPTYLVVNYKNKSYPYSPVFSSSWTGSHHQLKIELDVENNPIIYDFATTPFFYTEGELRVLKNGNWKIYPALANVPYIFGSLTRGKALNWEFSASGKINLAYIFSDTSSTPAIYNETEEEYSLLNETFSEIQGFESSYPGDFKIIDSNVVLVWERIINETNYHPYLAINWVEEGWRICKLGNDTDSLIGLAIIPQDSIFNIFYYDNGIISGQSRMFLAQVSNSTNLTTKHIHQFDGRVYFYHDSIQKLSSDNYVFLYAKRTYQPFSQTDLFMGHYDGTVFKEIQLTDTSSYMEYWAHCELGEEYLHYAWTQSEYKGTDTIDPEKSKLFYNRTLLSELENVTQYVLKKENSMLENDDLNRGTYSRHFILINKELILNSLLFTILSNINHY